MEMSFGSRLKHAWNAFNGNAAIEYRDIGASYSYRVDRPRLSRGNERSIVTSVYNRIAIDVAALKIEHVRLDESKRFLSVIEDGLNNCLSLEANTDQTARAFFQDVVISMFDEGSVAIVPVDTTTDPNVSGSYDINSMRVGQILEWYPQYIRARVYNEQTGKKEDILLPKSATAIIENPLYVVINEPNSTMQRLIRKLNLLDVIDEQSGSGKLDLIMQLPYVIKTQQRRQQAENRRKEVERQLSDSKYGIAYTDGTERITQLNRSVNNNLMDQIEYLTSMLYSQLGITQAILDGSADEKTMLNYYNRTIEPIVSAIVDEMKRKFLTKTARSQLQSIGASAKSAAGSLIGAAAALVLVAAAMKIISTIDPESIALGVLALGSAMTILVVGLQNMPDGTKAGGLLVAAIALLAISAALKALSSLSLTEIGVGIGAIAGILMTFVGVGALLSKFVGITPALTAFGKSMLIIGAAVALLGGGLVLLASGITALSVTTAAQVTAFVATIGVVAKAIIGFIPSIVEAVGEGIIKIISKLAESADVIAESLMIIVTSLLEIIGENLPSIVDQLLGFIVSIFKALTARIPEIIDAGVEFIVTLFSSIFDSLSGIEADMAEKAGKGILAVVAIIGGLALINPLITSAMAAVAKLALLIGEIGLIFVAFGELSKIPGLMELIEDGGNLLAKIGYAIGDFIGSIIGGFGAGLTSGLPEIGANLSAFMINATPFITGAKNVSGEVFTGAKTLAKALLAITGADVINSIASWLTGGNSVKEFADDLIPLGEAMVGFSDAVKGMDADVAAKAAAIAETLVSLAAAIPKNGGLAGLFGGSNDLKSFGSKLESFGTSLSTYSDNVQGVDSNKVNEATACVRSIVTLIKNIQSVDASALSNFSLALRKAATVSIKNFISAFDSGKKSASAAVTSMLTTIQKALDTAVEDIREYRSEFDQAGKDVAQDFILGIESEFSNASRAGWNLGREALIAAKKALDSNSPSKEFIELGKNIGEGMVIGINNGIVAVTSASAKMSNAAIEASKQGLESFQTWLEERKYYSEISLKEELAGWEALQKMYVEGSEERIKIDREVYRVQNELVEATYQYSMDWIDKKKNYNDLTLAEELAAYKRVQKRYAKGSAIREKLDLKVYQLEKEIADAQKQYVEDIQSAQEEANQKRVELEEEYAEKVKSINEQLESDIASLNKEYEDAIESRADTLYKSYGLFDEVAEREAVASDVLLNNLRNQIDEFTDWQRALSDLSARGVDPEFIKELQEMGVKSTAQIEALVSMTEDDLNEYVSLWSIKHALARSQAVDELKDLQDETQENIKKLREDAEKQLEEYRDAWQTELEQLNSDTATNLEALRKAFAEKVGIIKNDTQAEMQEMSETAQKILTDAGWDETGKQIVQGIIDGVKSEKSSFLDEITNMALASVEAVKTTLDINSPSRVFRELGNYTGLGFIKGLHDYIHGSYEAGSDVANSAKSGLSGVLQTFANLANDVLDTEPVIRPVLDLSDITAGAGAMNNLLSSGASLRLAGGAASTFGLNQGLTQTINVDNDGVISELRSLRGEMNNMTERIERLRIVLNTGTLVGELVDPMDTALGQKAALKGRGA